MLDNEFGPQYFIMYHTGILQVVLIIIFGVSVRIVWSAPVFTQGEINRTK